MKNQILLSKNILSVNSLSFNDNSCKEQKELVATILNNMAYYGFVPSMDMLARLNASTEDRLVAFWKESETVFKEFFKDMHDAKEGVVYKNFPAEVLNMSDAEYWFNQIAMYFGVNKSYFTEDEKPREEDTCKLLSLKVLQCEKAGDLQSIFDGFKVKKAGLTETEKSWVSFLLSELSVKKVNISEYAFKVNGAFVAATAFKAGVDVSAQNYTDILRFGAYLFDPEVNLNVKVGYFKFSRAERKQLLKMMLDVSEYEEDIARRKETFKSFFKSLRPGDFAWAKPVSAIYDKLYKDQVKSFNSKVETSKNDSRVFALLQSRPGVFLKKFHEMYAINSVEAIASLKKVLEKFTVYQLLKFKKYIETVNDNQFIIGRAHSTFEKAKVLKNEKVEITPNDKADITEALEKVLFSKMSVLLPEGVSKVDGMDKVYLPANDQEVSMGRGTVIDIPDHTNFLRTASYWISTSSENIWFDNSWNFIHKDTEYDDCACCWDRPSPKNEIAVFSGDPTNVSSVGGKAAQLIDVNLDKLAEEGYEYGVWTLLCYNSIPFSGTEKVFACMQYLNDQNKGELFEPSKVELQFEVKGNALNKAVVLLDVKNRKLICLDMPFPFLHIGSAGNNIVKIREFLKPLKEYMNAQPSVADLLKYAVKSESGVPFVYSDKDQPVYGKGFVFKLENENSEVEQIDLSTLLS